MRGASIAARRNLPLYKVELDSNPSYVSDFRGQNDHEMYGGEFFPDIELVTIMGETELLRLPVCM